MYKTIVYFDDLSEEAKEKAREWYREGNEMPFLTEGLTEFIRGELEELGYSVSDLEVLYSLSYCQGDGLSFQGFVTDKNRNEFILKNSSGSYVHSNMMGIDQVLSDMKEEEDTALCDLVLGDMRKIAGKAEKWGYDYIETENDDEHVDEAIRANEYTFSLNGERMNPDKE